MPRNFTPADRETVADSAEDVPWVHGTAVCGRGVTLQVVKDDSTYNKTFGRLMEKYGWYVDSVFPHDHGDVMILMPVTEVPE